MSTRSVSSFGNVFSEAELEFLGEDEYIEIVPNFRGERIDMISGSYGPFFPQLPTKVPLWLAVALKTRHKCSILTPSWMTVDKLSQTLKSERESANEFQPLPMHYIEISEVLFEADNDGNEIPDKYKVRTLIKDIRDVRFHKIESGMQSLTGKTSAIKLTNLSAMEVNIVRPFFLRALELIDKIDTDPTIEAP